MTEDLLGKLDTDQRELLLSCGRFAAARGAGAFLVGGSVRDLVLGRPHDDLDVVVEGDGLGVAQDLARSMSGELTRHHAFQTAMVTTLGGLRVDVATARSERYPRPGQLPQVVPGSLRDDLERRDFTINTMAVALGNDRPGTFLDPLGGLRDLHAGRIRVMHSRSFADDPTRVLRALRFALRFGYDIDSDTHGWLREAVSGGYLVDVSGDRVRKEIRLSFSEAPVAGPLRLQDEGVLQEVHRGLRADADTLAALEDALGRYKEVLGAKAEARDRSGEAPGAVATREADLQPWLMRLAACAFGLSPQARWELVRRLRLSREERVPVIEGGAAWRSAVQAWGADAGGAAAVAEGADAAAGGADPGAEGEGLAASDVERALRPLAAETLVVGAAATAGSRLARDVWLYLRKLRYVRPHLAGADLIKLGVTEGPQLGRFLDALRAARLDGEAETAADERRLVQAWLAENPR